MAYKLVAAACRMPAEPIQEAKRLDGSHGRIFLARVWFGSRSSCRKLRAPTSPPCSRQENPLSSPERAEVPLRWDERVEELLRSLVDALGSAAELVEEPAPAPQERAWLLQPASRDDAATLDGRTPLHQSATNGLRANHALWPSAGGQETVTNNGGRLVAAQLRLTGNGPTP
jgi:hypothetical protein